MKIFTNFVLKVPNDLVRLHPSTILVDDPYNPIKKTSFEIDQQRCESILQRTPRPTPNRYLSGNSDKLKVEDQQKFRETGNNALVRTLNSFLT